jgi:hypothetical protein
VISIFDPSVASPVADQERCGQLLAPAYLLRADLSGPDRFWPRGVVRCAVCLRHNRYKLYRGRQLKSTRAHPRLPAGLSPPRTPSAGRFAASSFPVGEQLGIRARDELR